MEPKIVTEISCYVENKPGIMAKLSRKLAENKIFIDGIQVYEGQLQSLLLLVVDDSDKAEKVLREQGIDLITRTDILEVNVDNKIGGLANVVKKFEDNGVNIKTIYSSKSTSDMGCAYIRVDDVKAASDLLVNQA